MKKSKYLFFYSFIVILCVMCNIWNNIIIFAFTDNTETIEDKIDIAHAKKYIALTFDDGPHPAYTIKVLDILAEKNITATFFVVGFRAELHPALLQKMKELNCEIGNHTYDHVDLSKSNKSVVISQIEKCSKIIYSITGEYPQIYRPPFGAIGKVNEQYVPLKKVLWTIDSCDWKTDDAEKIIQNIITAAKDKSIILMHDFYAQTIKALPEIIDILSEEGYEFATVSRLAELAELAEFSEFLD